MTSPAVDNIIGLKPITPLFYHCIVETDVNDQNRKVSEALQNESEHFALLKS